MRRERYPKEVKEQLIKEALEVGNATQVARRHGIDPKRLDYWISAAKHKSFQETPADAKKVTAYVPSSQEFSQLESENAALKKLLGEKALEIQILQDLVKKTNPGYRRNWK
ncbi:transposase [Heliophilum fasciatum]|uniref:Transposase n=1 Tax=Heliophilum fasciatum TaxID=35700 RepID=A0A4V2SVX5_9FIRM|nr:transposase [Heliophilum fasciatum]MCW2279401.1 transposase-like protein [Heliophilum fasciatum]TCP60086.1 transposase [Heliophilum fasciatum]